MIAKGNPHNSGPYLARYLAASSKGNESAELAELRGFASDNIFDAFALAQLLAEGTHCQKPLFHVQVRTPKGEELTREQWFSVADRIEKQLGFSGQPRAIVFHEKDGHRHMHLAWSRIDAETMHAIDPGLYKRKLKEICRKLEKEMGLQQVRNEREPSEKTQPPARGEFEQGRRLKTDVKAIREGIRDCWDRSEDGAGFVAALEKERLILAKGDKRSFVVVDEMGGYHALGKRITGATAEQTRVRLADIEAGRLPTVEGAQAMQRERREQEKGAMADQQEMTDEDRRKEEAEKAEAARLDTRAPGAARREAEPEAARETARRPQPVQDKEQARAPVKAEKAAQEREQRQDKREPFPEIEYGQDVREAWRGAKDGPGFSDRLKAKGYILARDGEGTYDYTVQDWKTKIAAVAVNGYAYRLDPERVGADKKGFAARIRETEPAALPSLEEARARQKAIREHKQPERQAEKRPEPQPEKAAPSIMVQERQPGKPRGEPQKLTDFVKGLPDGPEPSKRPATPAELRNNPAAKRDHYAQFMAEQQRGPAIDRMGEDMKAGRPLSADDVRKLNKADREGLKERGASHLKELVQQRARERTQERERD